VFLIAQSGGTVWSAFPKAYVTDFVDIKIWPVWNVADMCIVGGALILAWVLWREERAAVIAETVSHER
jgi:lipoprotein signal peptidase